MDPLTIALLSSLGGGAISAIAGSGDKTIDTTRSLSSKERAELLQKIFGGIDEQFTTETGSATSALERRGLGSPGQVAGITSRLKGEKAKAKSSALSDVNLARQGQQFIPGQGLPGIGDLSQALSFYLSNRKKKDTGTGFTSSNFLDNIKFGNR